MNITYVKGDLFSVAPDDAYLAHACNCLGKWGAGIAKEFAKLYPESYKEYVRYCSSNGANSLGTAFITRGKVICLMTSYEFNPPDDEKCILNATECALEDLATSVPNDAVIYSNKFNSGLFGVSWNKTEEILKWFAGIRPDVQWVVCDNSAELLDNKE